MNVTPRPDLAEDPLHAARLGLTGALTYMAIPLVKPPLSVGVTAAQRGAVDPAKMVAGMAAFAGALLDYWTGWRGVATTDPESPARPSARHPTMQPKDIAP